MSSSVRFLKKFFNSPSSIGSIVPSSPILVASIMAAIDWERAGVIVELGAGTGVVTRAINSRRVHGSMFISFEKDEQMRHDLQKRFPDIAVGSDAFHLLLELQKLGYSHADCIVSCLPFANFNRRQQSQLLASIYTALRPGGMLIAFQYSLQLQSQLEAVYEDVECQFVIRNIPPAFVYVCRKQVQ
jgi:phospholipid N-methyltransferase